MEVVDLLHLGLADPSAYKAETVASLALFERQRHPLLRHEPHQYFLMHPFYNQKFDLVLMFFVCQGFVTLQYVDRVMFLRQQPYQFVLDSLRFVTTLVIQYLVHYANLAYFESVDPKQPVALALLLQPHLLVYLQQSEKHCRQLTSRQHLQQH